MQIRQKARLQAVQSVGLHLNSLYRGCNARLITGCRLLPNEREVYAILTLRNQHTERLEAFKRVDCDALDRLDAELKGFWNSLVKQLLSGEIDGFCYEKGNTYIFTRSIKEPGKIQKSCFWNRNGEMIPLSDVQLSGFCAAEFPHGVSVDVQEREVMT